LLDLVFKTVSISPHSRSPAEHQTNKQPKQYIAVKGVYMREKKFIRTLSCLCVVLMACGTAFAQQGKIPSGPYKGPMMPMAAPEAPDAGVFYTNLVVDSCTTCNYSSANGYLVLGPNNCGIPGSTQWLAYNFIAAKSGAVKKVSLAITNWGICTPTSFQFTVAIYNDACAGVPNVQLGTSVTATAPAAPCLLATANFGHAAVTLTAGQTYWVVVTTSAAATQNGTTAVWWMANTGYSDYNLNDGMGWISFPAGSPGGFTVQ
jgi:hypothetical protein